MKKGKSILAVILVVAMTMAGAGAASMKETPAAEATLVMVTPRESAQLARYTAYIVALGDGMLEVAVDVYGTHKPMIKIGIEELHVECETSPGVWRDWAVYKNLYTENALSHNEVINVSGIVGRAYRVRVTVFAEDSRGRDTGTLLSGSAIAT